MMEHATAVEAAIYLMRFPSQMRLIRSRPLPDGVLALLRIAAADDEVTRQAAAWVGRSPETIRQAAGFFIEQILLYPDADSYRVLGATPVTSNEDLRRNMALLLRWLHPDLDHGERSVFATRVTRAWNDLKTRERRDTYDRSKRLSLADHSLRRKKRTARAPAKPQPMSHRLRHGERSAGGVGPYRSTDLHAGGFLHRLLLLLGRFAL
jgi:hypothetical protein